MRKIIIAAFVSMLLGILLFSWYQKENSFKHRINDAPIETNKILAIND